LISDLIKQAHLKATRIGFVILDSVSSICPNNSEL